MRVIRMAVLLLVVCVPASALAQDRTRIDLEFLAGSVNFADDGIVTESFGGAAGRWYVRPRVAVGPEFTYIAGDNHSHLTLTGNVTWDVFDASSPTSPRLIPFLVGGAGLFHTRESFPSGPFGSSEGAFTAGGGIRALAGRRLTLGAEVRLGWELHIRVNGTIGVRLGP